MTKGKNMAPLPPRPKDEKKVTNDSEKPADYLSERTLLEQQAGKEALNFSRNKHQEEVEAGMKSVELNERLARQR
jgi:hypothetical protein